MAELIPYPAIERHGVIGDRRTAALVAADGTIDWLCLPDYDGTIVFGAILDARKGGFWRLGPEDLRYGRQSYEEGSPIVVTRWKTGAYELQLSDAMAVPPDHHANGDDERVVLRRLQCTRGSVRCVSAFRPSSDFEPVDPGANPLWCSREELAGGCGSALLRAGDTVWMVLATGARTAWTIDEASRRLRDVKQFWLDAVRRFAESGGERLLIRSALTIRLLEYSPAGSIVAAPTASLPERIGSGWNADYRLTWLRDASLAMGTLARLGDLESASKYLEWLTERPPCAGVPLQVLYDIHGGAPPAQRERYDLDGYRGSKPVRFGNHAFEQTQLDSFGYFAWCVWEYLEHGGSWEPALGDLLRRVADHVAAHWSEQGNGVWELPRQRHYLSGRVMCWSVLDRALRIRTRFGQSWANASAWRFARDAIREQVETAGWSERMGAFRQSLDNDTLDASALLIPIVGFLPPRDPRVLATIDRIRRDLTIDGFVYRFDPDEVPIVDREPLGQYEGAFLPCTFWMATACALAGRTREAVDVLNRTEALAGPLGLFAEGVDARSGTFTGNTPLLFSHAEYIRAVQALKQPS